MAKQVKVGVKTGAGPLPGYLWSVYYLSAAREEAMGFLNECQYGHVIDLMRALASEPDPTHPLTVKVQAIDDFYELKDKGGVLGKINLRIFFTVDHKEKTILVLAAIKKEEDGQTPSWAKTRVRFRLRKFRDGEFGRPA